MYMNFGKDERPSTEVGPQNTCLPVILQQLRIHAGQYVFCIKALHVKWLSKQNPGWQQGSTWQIMKTCKRDDYRYGAAAVQLR